MSQALEMGRRAEELAAHYLSRQGYVILDRHYSCRGGELDLVACKDGCITFAEVKYRSTERFGRPEEAITKAKILSLSRAAAAYIAELEAEKRSLHAPMDYSYSFDVLTVSGPDFHVRHYPNAFTPVGFD